jgi:ribosomal 30S subunit maturation factor RimM
VIEGGGGEAMIPMVAGICVRVDIGARLIVVNPPDGLLELNAPARREAGGNGRGR